MVIAKVQSIEFRYPVLSVFVNFSDDAGVLPQPQVLQLSFSGDELKTLDAISLESRINDYIGQYEEALARADAIKTEINKEFDNTGVIVGGPVDPIIP